MAAADLNPQRYTLASRLYEFLGFDVPLDSEPMALYRRLDTGERRAIPVDALAGGVLLHDTVAAAFEKA